MSKNRNTTNEKVLVLASQPQGKRKNLKRQKRRQRNTLKPTLTLEPNNERRTPPVSFGRKMTNQSSFQNLRFPKREYLGVVLGTGTEFAIVSYPLNPGSFPWCKKIAACFESYVFHKMRVRYIPRCSTTLPGSVALVPDFNPSEPAPSTDVEAFQNQGTASGSSWEEFSQDYNSSQLKKRKSYFCRRNGNIVSGGDKDLYDTGNLHVICSGNSGSGVIGQLWIEYEVEFFTPEGSSDDTLLGRAGSFSAVNPLNPTSAVVKDPANIADVSVDVSTNQSLLTFKKDFHGFLELKNAGVGMAAPSNIPYALTQVANLLGQLPQINLTEDIGGGVTYNGNSNIINTAQTLASLVSLISAPQGSGLKITMPLSAGNTFTGSDFSLTRCFL